MRLVLRQPLILVSVAAGVFRARRGCARVAGTTPSSRNAVRDAPAATRRARPQAPIRVVGASRRNPAMPSRRRLAGWTLADALTPRLGVDGALDALRGSLLGLLGMGLLLAVAGCAPPVPGEDAEFRMPVEVEDVTTGTVEDLVVATGNLRPREIVTLNIETPGHLQIARNDEGERLAEGMRVSAGDVIARVTGEDARLHARLETTRQALEAAEAQLARRRELHAANLGPEEELQTAEERYENALYNFERSTLDAAKATLTTPIDGTILRLARDTNQMPQADGQLVQPGFAVAEIAPLDELIADIDLIGPELGRVEVGLAARIRHYAFDDTLFPGEGDSSLARARSRQAHVPRRGDRRQRRTAAPSRDVRGGHRRHRAETGCGGGAPVTPSPTGAGNTVVFAMDGQRVSRREVRLGLGGRRQSAGAGRRGGGRPRRRAWPRDPDRRQPRPRSRTVGATLVVAQSVTPPCTGRVTYS